MAMIIEQLQLKRFKRFTAATLDFVPGLNVIRGRNEAGKTTLHEALKMILYQLPRSTAQVVQQSMTWEAEQKPELMLAFSANERRYQLHKDFEERTALLEDLDQGEQWR